VQASWTLTELVAEVATRIAALPVPRNGQVRAIPDERTVRYYATIGLLDRPAAMRGRTALYGHRHVAQVVAIKRLQAMGRSLSEIQTLWPTLDAHTLARMSGVALAAVRPPGARTAFWKREATQRGPGHGTDAARETPDRAGARSDAAIGPDALASMPVPVARASGPVVMPAEPVALPSAVTVTPRSPVGGVVPAGTTAPPANVAAAVELRVELAPNVILSLSVVDESIAVSPADVRAIRAAAAPLVAELAFRRLTPHPGGEEP
jgi:DNA-binding transcriptional MerR regulator